jgi:peptide/nickel transport system substrate-binding protein
MRRKVWLTLAAAAAGAALLAAAAEASPAAKNAAGTTQAKVGGTLRVNLSNTDFDFLDPALAYAQWSWQVTYVTELKLLNYPDKPAPAGSQLVPDAAGFPTVSNGGKTYTFVIKPGFKFNTGQPVTAANFAAAINRDLNPAMQSPAVPFLADIVGADAVSGGKAKTASGVKASGMKLTITIAKPDPTFVARISMPFVGAIPTNLPINAQGEETPPSAGPYYVASWTKNRQAIIKKNPNYHGTRPHNLDQIVYTIGGDFNQSFLQIKAGQADYDGGGVPPTQVASVQPLLGKQLFVSPEVETDYVALNTSPGHYFSNVAARKAFNYAIDRPAMIRARGALAGKRTDQVLPPGMPGYKQAKIYPFKGADPAKAKQLYSKAGKVVLYTGNAGAALTQGQVLQYNLKQWGVDTEVHQYSSAVLYAKAGTKGEPFDAVLAGWGQDYPDPYDFLDVLLNGNNIHETSNNNLAYFNDPAMNAKLKAAASLAGSKRYQSYGQLDIEITKNHAPWAAFDNRNNREFVSSRVDPKCFVEQPVYQVMDFAQTCLK